MKIIFIIITSLFLFIIIINNTHERRFNPNAYMKKIILIK